MPKRTNGENEKNYQVGYAKPPADTRFKPGESGNPKGRPSGTSNVAIVLLRTLREKVVINENGERKTITKLEAAIKQLVNKAAGGDLRAFQQLSALLRSAEEQAIESAGASAPLGDIDQKVLEGIMKRFENTFKETNNNETERK